MAAPDSTSNNDSDSERPSLWEGWCLLWMFRVGTDAAGTRQWRVCGKHCIAKQGIPSAAFCQDLCNPLRLQLLKRDTHHGRPGCNLGLEFVCWLDCNVVFSVCQVMCFGVRKRQHVAGLLLIDATCAPWLSQSTHHHPSQLQAVTHAEMFDLTCAQWFSHPAINQSSTIPANYKHSHHTLPNSNSVHISS